MNWQPYESRGIAAIDMSLAEKLDNYLDGKEQQLSTRILEAIQQFHEIPPSLKPGVSSNFRLHEAVEEFGKKVQRLAQLNAQQLSQDEWKVSATHIQEALWQYIEVLEGSTTELFQQLDQIGFEHWDTQLSRAMGSIKDTLMHRMDDLIWAVRRLEQQLAEFRRICEMQGGRQRFWRNLFLRKTLLDSSMETLIIKCQKFLGFRYQKFTEKYKGYLQLHSEAEQSLQKFYSYRTLSSLDLDTQDRIKKIYQLLKLWELNLSAKALPKNEIIRALRSAYSPDGALALFREYYAAVKKGLFDKSRMIKKKFREVFQDPQVRQPLIDHAVGYRHELRVLAKMCAKFKEFLLATDPNPYVRSRLGFSEWIVGPEPKCTKQLQALIYDIEHLNALCETFQTAMESDKPLVKNLTPDFEATMAAHLREMGQPLASKPVMHSHAEAILKELKYLDEMSSFDPQVVEYVCKTLCKAMRSDWKYHVLQEIPLFHQIYEVHQSIVGPLEDRQHTNRLTKFGRILDQLDGWIKHNETLQHVHEVDLDINDIKAYLQDFFATVQSIKGLDQQANSEETLRSVVKARQAVLEYRYLFSKFFHKLRSDVPEERLIRKQFLFVDQYFEAIENRLEEINPLPQ